MIYESESQPEVNRKSFPVSVIEWILDHSKTFSYLRSKMGENILVQNGYNCWKTINIIIHGRLNLQV